MQLGEPGSVYVQIRVHRGLKGNENIRNKCKQQLQPRLHIRIEMKRFSSVQRKQGTKGKKKREDQNLGWLRVSNISSLLENRCPERRVDAGNGAKSADYVSSDLSRALVFDRSS